MKSYIIHICQVGKASHHSAEASRNSRSFTQYAMAAMAGPSTEVQPEGATGAELSAPEQMLCEIRCRNFFQVAKICQVESGPTVVPSLPSRGANSNYVLNRFEIVV